MNMIMIKRYKKVTDMILVHYVRAMKDPYVRKPLAYALHKVWESIDKEEEW